MTDLVLTLNGTPRSVPNGAQMTLLEALRALDVAPPMLCGEGACGSCLVLVGQEPVAACLTLTALVGTAPVETAAGLADPVGRAVRAAFAASGADACPLCSAGMMVAATHALRISPWITDDEVRAALLGQTCRCSGYEAQVAAVMQAALALQGGGA